MITNGTFILGFNLLAVYRISQLDFHYTVYQFFKVSTYSEIVSNTIISVPLMWLLFTITLILFIGRTDHFEIIERSLTNLPINEEVTSEIKKIQCIYCSQMVDLPRSLNQIFSEQDFIFCTHCKKKIWWFDMKEIDEEFLLVQHRQIINDFGKKGGDH